MRHDIDKPNATAIITGASSGIGRVYADRLARRGYDIVLVARRRDRLIEAASSIKDLHGVQAQVLVADLATAQGVAAVAERIGKDDVSLLVNNAGFSVLRSLTLTDPEVIDRMIALNISALTQLTRTALAAFERRSDGTVINIGSAAGFSPYPGIPVYGATKAYVHLFTESLQSEVAGSAVRVQLVLPGAVASEGWEVAGGAALDPLPQEIIMSAEDCVDAALAGLDAGEKVTAPSLADLALLRNYDAAGSTLLNNAFSAAPAARYALDLASHATRHGVHVAADRTE